MSPYLSMRVKQRLTLIFFGSVNARFNLCICSRMANASIIKSPPSVVVTWIRHVIPIKKNHEISMTCHMRTWYLDDSLTDQVIIGMPSSSIGHRHFISQFWDRPQSDWASCHVPLQNTRAVMLKLCNNAEISIDTKQKAKIPITIIIIHQSHTSLRLNKTLAKCSKLRQLVNTCPTPQVTSLNINKPKTLISPIGMMFQINS